MNNNKSTSGWLWFIPLVSIIIAAYLLRVEIRSGLEKLGKDKQNAVTIEEIEIFNYLRNNILPGSTILTSSYLLDDELPAFVGHSWGVTLRDWDSMCSDLANRQTLNRDFYTIKFMTNKHLETLKDCHIQYIIIENGTELTTQFEFLTGMFNHLYTNTKYSIYLWQPEKISDAEPRIIKGNTYLLENRLISAEAQYLQALDIEVKNPLALLGLGAVEERRLNSKQAFSFYKQVAELLPDTTWIQTKLSEILEINPQQLPLYLARGDLYRMGKDVDLLSSRWPVYTFLDHLDLANISAGLEQVHRSTFIIDKTPKGVLFQHPTSRISYEVNIPPSAQLSFSVAIAPEVWKLGLGDGVQFDIYIRTNRLYQKVFSKYIDPKNVRADRRWFDYVINLSPWAGQTVTITFASSPGPNGDNRYDWAGWGEPRIVQPVVYDFLAKLRLADYGGADNGQIRRDVSIIEYEPRSILFQHPSSRVTYRITMPEQAMLNLGLGMNQSVWLPDKGDGVEYNIYIRKPVEPNKLYRVFHRYIDPKNNPEDRHWFDETVDLSEYGGHTVEVIFEALPGPSGDNSFDWGGWSNPVLVAARP